jgi:hypothetical protein
MNTTGVQNTAIGMNASCSGTSGNYNVSVGNQALQTNTIGSCNIAIGACALHVSTTASYNVAIGKDVLKSSTTAQFNVGIGHNVMPTLTVGTCNTALGYSAMVNSTTSTNNTAIGYKSAQRNTIGSFNTSIGSCSLYTNTTGVNNIAVGACALHANTVGFDNTAVGTFALQCNTTGYQNVAIGRKTLLKNTTGIWNVALGTEALTCNTGGNYNIAIGKSAMGGSAVTVNSASVMIGYQAGIGASGAENVGIGFEALKQSTGNKNTSIGHVAGDNVTSGSGNIAIGAIARVPSATADRQLVIASTVGSDTTTWLSGDSSGKIGIGTTSPQTTLHIAAQIPKIRIEDTDLSGMAFDIRGAGPAVHFDLDPGSSQALADYMWDIGGSTKMKLRGTGRLGIGTTTPSQALDVVGSIEVSDGIYIGGTAAANKLDDYEEGTFTPTIGPGDGLSSVSYTTQSGVYTKVGRIVHFRFFLRCSGTANGNDINIYGLPFTSSTSEIGGAVFAYLHSSIINSTSTNPPVLQIPTNNTFIKFQKTNGSDFTGNDLSSTGDIQFYITGTYETA